MLDSVKRALELAADFEVTGATQHGDELAALVDEHRPDLVLLDLRLGGADGISCLRAIRGRHPKIKIIMLSASEDPARIGEALDAGASAYICKRISPDDLASALRQIVTGVIYRAVREPDAAEAAVAAPDSLTQRELVLLDAIARGLSTKMISRELWITERTVKFHLTNIYRKLGVHNRTGAMRYAYEHGLLERPALAEAASA